MILKVPSLNLFFSGPRSQNDKVSVFIGKIIACTGCPKKNASLSLEVNIYGLNAPIGQSWTSFENYMFSAFILLQEQVNSIPAPLRKLGFKKIT